MLMRVGTLTESCESCRGMARWEGFKSVVDCALVSGTHLAVEHDVVKA